MKIDEIIEQRRKTNVNRKERLEALYRLVCQGTDRFTTGDLEPDDYRAFLNRGIGLLAKIDNVILQYEDIDARQPKCGCATKPLTAQKRL